MLAQLTEIAIGSLTTAALGAVLYNPLKRKTRIIGRRHDADGCRGQCLGWIQEDSMIEIIERRIDGSFVITHEGNPYHVTPDYAPELWAAVCAQEELDPEAQAAVYAASMESVE